MSINEAKMNELLGRFVGDFGATIAAPLILIGDELGLYRALAPAPLSAAQLANKTGTNERYVAEWLAANAASGYVEYEATTGRYSMSPEQAFAFADPNGPNLPGAYLMSIALFHDLPTMTEAFRSGKGIAWGDHHHALFHATEKFFRPNYAANLMPSWLPALEGVVAKLEKGALVADVACGHGASTILMAQAYPKSKFVGFDYHAPSLEVARQKAKAAGVADRVSFEQASAKNFPGRNYDLVAFFDCLHDMGDPVGAAKHVRETLAADGTWLIVEPFAHDRVEQNLNPVGRVFYSASTQLCTPCSRSQEVGIALGAQAGEARLREVVVGGGFTRFRRATETPFNLILEARP
jgi:SAM-dependent methyltransferase